MSDKTVKKAKPTDLMKTRATSVATKGFDFLAEMVPWDEHGFAPGRAVVGSITLGMIGGIANLAVGFIPGLFSPNVIRAADPQYEKGHNTAVVFREYTLGASKGVVAGLGIGAAKGVTGLAQGFGDGWQYSEDSFAKAQEQQTNWAAMMQEPVSLSGDTPQRLPGDGEVASYVQPVQW
jgi:hypothetical protein